MIDVRELRTPFVLVETIYGPQVMGHHIPLDVVAHACGVRQKELRTLLDKHDYPVYKLSDDTLFLSPYGFSLVPQLLNIKAPRPFTYADLITNCAHCRK